MKKHESTPSSPAPRLLRRLPWLLLLPLGLLWPWLAAPHAHMVESVFSRRIFPVVNGALGTLTGFLPFSLAEMLLYLLAVSLPIALLVRLIQCLFARRGWQRLAGFVLSLAIAAGALLNGFYFTWGLNYFRPPLSELMQLSVRERPVKELERLCETLLNQALPLRERVAEDENGVFALPEGREAAFARVPAAYAALGREYALFSRSVPNVKSVLSSKLMSCAGISGIFIPFTQEANVNVDQPPLLLLSSAAHESAHFLGIAPENEANFAAYLACISSDDPALAYSGVMLALINSGNQLYAADEDAYRALRARYSDGMVRDLADYAAYWDSFKGPVEETVDRVNDRYLKYNGQQSGVKSYGEMVDLLLAYYSE